MRPPNLLLKNHRIPHRDGPPLSAHRQDRRGRAYPQSVELMAKNTNHIPESQLLRINSPISSKLGKCLLSFPVSNSPVAAYVPDVWESLEPRYRDFGIGEVDLIKRDCEGLST